MYPLQVAAAVGNAEIAKMLIEYGAHVDVKREGGDTALYMAAAKGHMEIVEILQAAGAQLRPRQDIDEVLKLIKNCGIHQQEDKEVVVNTRRNSFDVQSPRPPI